MRRPIGVHGMAAAQPSSDSLAPPLRRRSRRLVFDRRYGWIFDDWAHPADQALAGGRGMFCAFTMVRSLMNVAASSVNCVSSSIGRVLEPHNNFYLPADLPSMAFNKKQRAWLRELENSRVVADLKLINYSSQSELECRTADCLCLTRQHDLP